jgi:hypothetical protein
MGFATLFATQNKKPLDYQGVLLILSGPDGILHEV